MTSSDYAKGVKAGIEAAAWQPIETAPKDGTHYLVATPEGVVGEAFFETETDCWYWSGNHYTDAHDGSVSGVAAWMPLPPPPSSIAAEVSQKEKK